MNPIERNEGKAAVSTEPVPKIPRIPFNIRDYKSRIAIQASIVILSSCILPLVGYFSLHYATTLKTQYILSIVTPIFGVVSLFGFIARTIRLARKSSTCRPLGATNQWTLDFFDWNFVAGFVVVSVIISIGISRNPSNVRIVALPLVLLLLQVCGQMVLLIPLRAMGFRALFRISSYRKGELARPASFTIAEDVVAVDGNQGEIFRAAWTARYEASAPFRKLLARLDVLWGVSGMFVATGVIAVIFAVPNDSVGWAIG